MAPKDRSEEGPSESRHWVEWIVGSVGALIVAGSILFLGYQGITGNETPPSIVFRIGAIRPVASGHLVEFSLSNKGGSTAAKLRVRGLLLKDNRIVESSEATFDYAPPQSERHGGLIFAHNPRQFEIRIRAEGYEKP